MATPSLTGWWRHIRLRAHEGIFDRARGLLKSAQLVGWSNSAKAILYTVHRARLDRRLKSTPATSRAPGAFVSAEPSPGGATFTYAQATLEVRFLAGGGIFLAWDGATPMPSYALASSDHDGAEPAADESSVLAGPHDDGDCWSVTAGGVVVTVDQAGAVAIRTGDGKPLRYDPPPRWDGDDWEHRSVLESDAAVVGLGGRSAPLDRKGRTYRLWNSDPGGTYTVGDDPLSLSIPLYLVVSDGGCHGAFYDNTYDGTVSVGADEVTFALTGGPLRYYVFPGTPAEVLDRYTQLTGRPAVPPRWALGYHQCRWGYGSEAAVRGVVDQFAEHELPLSGIWLDIDHLVERAPFAVDETRYPDLGGFAKDMLEREIHTVVIADPGLIRRRGNPTYDSGRRADVFCRDVRGRIAWGVVWPGWTVFPDFTAPHARKWWSDLYEGYIEQGIAGFWHDMNEPSTFVVTGDGTLPLSTKHNLDGRGGDHREAHNVYGLTLNRAGFEGVSRLRPGRRPYLISRSGYAGLQRYAGTWTGDIGTSWEGLAISLSFTLGLGLSGMPYSGPDIGGFDQHPEDELYVRWFQLAAYLPFFRVHCAAALPFREPWAFGPTVLSQIKPALFERYELLPYWYTLAFEAGATGAPYVRPMLWAHPDDAAMRWVDDQFMLGPSVLVAPVLENGAREREVWLPAGRWYDRATGQAHDGPGPVTVPAEVDRIPVFVRGGAVLPVTLDGVLTLEAYVPGPADAEVPGGVLVADEGDGDAEPVRETFRIETGADGARSVSYEGPASELPYPVRWVGSY